MAGWAVFQKECLTFLRKDTKIPTMEKEIKINLGACLYLVFFILLGLKLAGLISAPWWVIMTPLILLFITFAPQTAQLRRMIEFIVAHLEQTDQRRYLRI